MPSTTSANESARSAVRELAERQHGHVARIQLTALGMSRHGGHHLVSCRDWEPVGRRVLRLVGSPRTSEAAAMAAVLDAGDGALLSHTSAAALWGLPGFLLEPLHVATTRREVSRTEHLATVHRHRALASIAPTVHSGVPVVRPEVAFIQLCGSAHPFRAAIALDRAWSKRLLSGPSVRRVLDQVATRGLTGVTLARELLDERGDDYVPPASGVEDRFGQILREAGLPEMRRQVDCGSDELWCGRVDFRAHDVPAIVEVQSETYHSSLSDVRHDAERRARLEGAGFSVEEVTDHQVWHARHEVIEAVRRVRRRATAGPSSN